MGKLLRDLDLFEPLRVRMAEGLPVFGTCAGLILLARTVEGGTPCFAAMDIAVKRNAYGRQLGSFYTQAPVLGIGTLPMTFIRAPYIASAGPAVQVLAQVDGRETSWRPLSIRSSVPIFPSTAIFWPWQAGPNREPPPPGKPGGGILRRGPCLK